MDGATLVLWLLGFGVSAVFGLSAWQIARRIRQARNWPSVDATIDSAEMGRIGTGRKIADLPCFAFSYVVNGRSYSGHFALRANGDRAESLMRQMVEKKMAIHYDPTWPGGWYIPVDTIGGFEVVQKLYHQANPQEAKD